MADTSADLISLKNRLEGLSDRLRSHARTGFGFISEMSPQEQSVLLNYVVECLESGADLDDVKGAKISGLSEKRVQNIFTAATLVGYAVLDFEVDAQTAADIIPNYIIEEKDRASAKLVADLFYSRRSPIKDGLDKKLFLRLFCQYSNN